MAKRSRSTPCRPTTASPCCRRATSPADMAAPPPPRPMRDDDTARPPAGDVMAAVPDPAMGPMPVAMQAMPAMPRPDEYGDADAADAETEMPVPGARRRRAPDECQRQHGDGKAELSHELLPLDTPARRQPAPARILLHRHRDGNCHSQARLAAMRGRGGGVSPCGSDPGNSTQRTRAADPWRRPADRWRRRGSRPCRRDRHGPPFPSSSPRSSAARRRRAPSARP